MRKLYSMLVLLLCLSTVGLAAPVQPQKAKQLADNFFGRSASGNRNLNITYQAKAKSTTADNNENDNLYYVINRGENNGFVVISADSRTRAVLAYSDEGCLDEQTIQNHPSVRWMFEEYARQIEWAKNNMEDSPSPSYRKLASGQMKAPVHIIEPLLEVDCNNRARKLSTPISWGQDWPFNLYSPNISYGGTIYPTVSGCVATAISSVLRWHRWPARPKGSQTYTWSRTGRNLSVNYDNQEAYDWENMPEGVDANGNDRVTGNRITEQQAQNIGRLLRDVGYGVKMNYGPSYDGGSGAYLVDAPATLVDNFDYDGRLECLMRSDYTYDDWLTGIQDEMTNYGPVVYAGFSSAGGHCFVLDGFATEGYVHVDWGWNKMSNCWSSIDVLEPDYHGIGGGVGAFSRGHQMLRYLKPSDGEFVPISISKGVAQTEYEKAANQSFDITFKNNRTKYFYGTFRLSVKKAGETALKTLATSYKILIDRNKERTYSFSGNLSAFTDGKYELYVSYSEDDVKWTDIKQSAGTITIGNAPEPPVPPVVTDPLYIYTKNARTEYTQEAGQNFSVTVGNRYTDYYYGTLKLSAKKSGATAYTDLATTSSYVRINSNDKAAVNFTADLSNLPTGSYDLRVSYANNNEWKAIGESAGTVTVSGVTPPVEQSRFVITQTCDQTFEKVPNQSMAITVKNQGSSYYYNYFRVYGKKVGGSSYITLGTTSSYKYIGTNSTATVYFTADFTNVEAGVYDLRLSYVENGAWKNIEAGAGRITVKAEAMGPKLIATTLLSSLEANEGEAISVEVPVANNGDRTYSGSVQLLAGGSVISEGTVTIAAGQNATLAFSTNTAAFNSLKAGEYALTVLYNGNEKVAYYGTENLGKLIIKAKAQPATAKGDLRLNSVFFYQNGSYVGSKYCTLSKYSDVTIRANVYSSNGFNGPVKFFITDRYGNTYGASSKLETTKDVAVGTYGSGYVDITFNINDFTLNHYYVNMIYNDGTQNVCKSWDAVSFYISSYYIYNGNSSTEKNEMGETVEVDGLTPGFVYLPVGISNTNVADNETTAVDEISASASGIYPAVASEVVNIVSNAETTAQIFNVQGTLIESVKLEKGVNRVPVSHYASGVYLVRLNKTALKFVKK